MSDKKSIYFPNINSIRFIAALLVVIGHINMTRDMFGYPSYVNNPFIIVSGKLGVILFFVLSGFLITYLLFKEQELTNTISIKNFYIRRILRIWPLYFMIVFLSLFLIPNIPLFTFPGYEKGVIYNHFIAKLLLYILILPNLVLSVFGMIPYVGQAWSIGAEEQFYLIWPVFMKKISNKLLFMFLVIFLYGAIKFTLNHYAPHYEDHRMNFLDIINRFWGSTPIDCMAIGGLFSYIGYHNDSRSVAIKKFLFQKWLQVVILVGVVIMLICGVDIPHIQHEFYAVLFGIIILNLALNKQNVLNLEYRPLNYLGKISYGIYMYHTIAIVICFKFLIAIGHIRNVYLYPMAILLTILISGLSYRFFEKPFISRKVRYSKVVSGENVPDHTPPQS